MLGRLSSEIRRENRLRLVVEIPLFAGFQHHVRVVGNWDFLTINSSTGQADLCEEVWIGIQGGFFWLTVGHQGEK